MSLRGLSSKTAELYLSAISFRCKVSGFTDNTKHFLVNKLLEGFRRQCKSKRVRLPITIDLLRCILTKLSAVCTNNYESLLFKAAYVTAFFGFFRVGEITIPSKVSTDTSKVLNRQDISFVDNESSMLVTLRYSKTDQLGKGMVMKINQTGSSVCPVLVVQHYLKQRPKVNGPLFCHFDGSPLTRYQFCFILRKVIKLVDPKLEGYKSHSFRIGAATRAAQLGWPVEKIKEAGRWASDAYKSYLHKKDDYREISKLA